MSLVSVAGVSFAYRGRAVLHNINLELAAGGSLGIVGESGAGKSTLLSLLLGVQQPQAGTVSFRGKELKTFTKQEWRDYRRAVQAVFQDPYSSLNPRLKISQIVAEPLHSLGIVSGAAARERVIAALENVGLEADHMNRYPHEFSGGQRQRIAIARAIAPRPELLIADEPVSALDVSTKVQVIELLQQLQHENNLALIMVSHDLTTVAATCKETAVLKDGKIMEIGNTARLLQHPETRYTKQLLSAVATLGEYTAAPQ